MGVRADTLAAVDVYKNLFDERRVFNTGNDPDRTATQFAGLNVDPEHSLEATRLASRSMRFGARSAGAGRFARTASGRGDQGSPAAVGCKDTVIASEIDSRAWN